MITYTPDQVRAGGWLVTIYKAISYYDVDDPAFDAYEAAILAGKAGQLLSSVRALGQIDGKKYEIYRRIAHLKSLEANDVALRFEKLGILEIQWDKTTDPPAIAGIRSLATTKAEVLAAAAQLFDMYRPTDSARAAIDVLDATVHIPVQQSQIMTALSKRGFRSDSIIAATDALVSLELIARTEETESGEPLLYNPHVFNESAQDAYKVLTALSSKDHQHALQLLEHVRTKPGVPFPASADRRIVSLLAKTGIIDISGIQLKSGVTSREFPTAPDVWGVFSHGGLRPVSKDLIDDSKLLLNSLRYGELYSLSGRGRIDSPSVLIGALIKRGQVGPATAIGEDYPLPLARGIVSITESRMHPGRFFMELRKSDVAEAVRDVLEQNAILPAGEVATPEILQKGGGAFHSPEHMRIKRQLPKELMDARDSLAFELRTYRKRA
jgi:hypothetical protein